MSDKHIEKSFLYLVLISVLLHVAVFGVFSLIPPDPQRLPKDTTEVELKDLPEPPPVVPKPKPKPKPKPEPKTAPKPMPIPPLRTALVPLLREPILPPLKSVPTAKKEAAPKAESKIDRIVQSKAAPNLPGKTEPPQEARSLGKTDSLFHTPETGGTEASRGEGIPKIQRGTKSDLAKLFPSGRSMAKMEENFRKKYQDVEQGDTRLMDTDDPDIGSFSRRFVHSLEERLNAIDPFTRKGRGETVLNITFKRDGTIENIKILYSSGNKSLEDLAIQASRSTSFIGPLPRRWTHDVLNLVCSFTIDHDGIGARWGVVER